MRSYKTKPFFFPLLLSVAAMLATTAVPSYGEETENKEAVTPATWDAPSTKVDSAVASWATERLRPRSASVPTAKPVDSPAAIDAFQKIDRTAPTKINRVEPVRYEQPISQESGSQERSSQKTSGSNPLRLSQSTSSSIPSDAARLAFRETEPVESESQSYRLEQQDSDPLATAAEPMRLKVGATSIERLEPVERSADPKTEKGASEPYRLATRSMVAQSQADEPRSFESVRDVAPARSMNEEPSVILIPEEAFETNVRPIAEQPSSIEPPPATAHTATPLAGKLTSAQQTYTPQNATYEADPETDQDLHSNWNEAPLTPSREGTGRPGGRELVGPQEGSLVVEKRGPEEARVGQTSRFILTVRNAGQSTAKNVVLYDETPEGAELVGAIPPAANENGRLVWRLGTVAPGEERSVEVRIKPLREGTIGSVASVSFETMASAAMRSTRPQLAIRIRAAERVLVGQKQRVEIELHNPGTGIATGVVLVEDVPDNLRHEAGPELEMEIGTLAPGETRRLDLTLTAAQAGRAVNTVTAFANGDLRAEKSVTFDVVAPSLNVSIDGPKRRYLERPASYTIHIDNPGSAPAKEVRLVTHLPQGIKFVSANNMGEYDNQTHSVYWSLAELPEGERGAVEVVGLPITAGEHTLTVEGEALNGLKATESQQLVIEGIASLAFDVRDLQDPIEVGAEAAYDVVVTNEGTKAASAVRVVLEAPVGMKVVSAKGHTAHRLSDERVEFAPIDRLEPGVKVLYRVRLRGELPGDQRVTVLVESDDLRTPIRREESTRVFGDD